MTNSTKKLLPTRNVCARYQVVHRTIDRWVQRGVLPPALWINGRRYWDEEELQRREREVWPNTTREPQVRLGSTAVVLAARHD